jgi:hypothetical protein
MAAKHTTAADLMRGLVDDFRRHGAWQVKAKRFDVLDQPFVFERPASLSRKEAELRAFWAQHEHRNAMMRLLRERASFRPSGALSKRQTNVLLGLVVRTYVPAFRPAKIVPAKRAPGRPPSGLTDRQKAVIKQAVADGKSVRWACLRLAKDDRQAADAMAAAWRRAMKRVRRK